MSLYIETIKLQDGKLNNLGYHQQRFEKTRSRELGRRRHPDLRQVIQVPDGLDRGLLKCRVVYGKEIERIEFEPHGKRKVNSLKLVVSDTLSYGYKYFDRSSLDLLLNLKGTCDDILIVKQGCITDSYAANVVFWDGYSWYTPDTPLLPGTMRAALIDQGVIRQIRVTPDDLPKYQMVRLINALNTLQEGPEISVEAIKY